MRASTSTAIGRRIHALAWAGLLVATTLATTLVTATPASAAPGDITTFAGGGIGDNGPASSARLGGTAAVNTDAAGNVYVADQGNNRIRRISPAGVITTVAGTGAAGFGGDGGPAVAALLSTPAGVALDAAGNLYIADLGNARIRKVDTKGIITTIAGNGVFEDMGDGGPALSAAMSPQTLAVDPAGHNLYFVDQGSSRVRRVDLTDGTVHAFAGLPFVFEPPFIFFGGDGGPAVDAHLSEPQDIAIDAFGNVFIADLGNSRVRRVDTNGIITTVVGNGDFASSGDGGPAVDAAVSGPGGLAFLANGALLITDEFSSNVRMVVPGANGVIDGAADEIISTVAGTGESGFGGDGGPALQATFDQPVDIARDPAGNLYIADAGNRRVRKIDLSGVVTTLAGGGVGDQDPATSAALDAPYGIAIDAAGNTFVSEQGVQFAFGDSGNRVRRVSPSGVITTVAGTGTAGFSGDGGPATSAQLDGPRGLALDPAGNLYIADCGNHRVRKVTPGGIITTFAGNGSDGSGGDNGLATSASLSCPSGLLFTGGALYIADSAANRVRRVSARGVITTVAGTGVAGFGGDGGPATQAKLNSPEDLAVDAAGNLYIADELNNRVRKVTPGGIITTYAGDGGIGLGPDTVAATAAHINTPTGLTIGPDGALYIAEAGFARVRRVSSRGVITTVAGNGVPGFTGDNGPATRAQLDRPTDVAFDAAGNLLITDRNNNRVRRLQAGPPAPPPTTGCGAQVTASLTLTADLGPCPAEGLLIGADNITVNLGGHRILGTGARAGVFPGITVSGHKGVTITNGTISGFDAGVAIVGGTSNTVSRLTVRDNFGATADTSEYGDGIVAFFSTGNRIVQNLVTHNGPFDGIAILGVGSNNNVIQGNTVELTTSGFETGTGIGIAINPFLSFDLPRNVSVTGNQIIGNTVRGNDNGGISNLSNIAGSITDNLVTANGTSLGRFPGNGIGVNHLLNAKPQTRVVVKNNQVHGNGTNGIDVLSEANTIIANDASGNTVTALAGTAFDLHDETPACDSNVWSGNVWGRGGFDPVCTTAGGHPAPPAASGAAAQPGPAAAASAPARAPQAADPPPRHHPPLPA